MLDPSKLETNQQLGTVLLDRQTSLEKPAAGGELPSVGLKPSFRQPTPGAFSS
jgi:hypothetical protein